VTEQKNTPANQWRWLPWDEAERGPDRGFCMVVSNNWWITHPEKGLLFFWSRGTKGLGSPQCNPNESLSRRLGDMSNTPGSEIRFVKRVFVPIHIRDYA